MGTRFGTQDRNQRAGQPPARLDASVAGTGVLSASTSTRTRARDNALSVTASGEFWGSLRSRRSEPAGLRGDVMETVGFAGARSGSRLRHGLSRRLCPRLSP
jgi:hypothetical protein